MSTSSTSSSSSLGIGAAPFAPGGAYAIDATLGTRLLTEALSHGADYAELYFEYRTSGDFVLEEQRIRTVGRGVLLGLGVRVLKGDSTGYAYTESLDWDDMVKAARTAARIATSGKAPDVAPLAMATPPSLYNVTTPSVAAPGEDKVALLRRADAAARAYDPRIIRSEVSLGEEIKEILIMTSDGTQVRDVQPMVRFSVRAVAEEGGKRQSGSSGGGGRMGLDYFLDPRHTPEAHGKEAGRVAIAMLDAKEAPAGPMEVVLAPGDSGVLLHEAVGHGLEADFNRKQTSNYSGRVGQQVASTLCTVIDDGLLPSSRGSINVDDEGRPPGKHVLIENGILVGYMHDRLSAKHFQAAAGSGSGSGNGRRQSFRYAPMPRMTNTLLTGPEGKTESPEDILKSVKRGVYAKRFSGGQVNISNGDFVFSLTEGYLIENGKLTQPLKDVNLIGNGPDVLTKVTAIGNDFMLSDGMWTCGKDGQSVPVGVGTPTVKISAITVGGTQIES